MATLERKENTDGRSVTRSSNLHTTSSDIRAQEESRSIRTTPSTPIIF
jgi:hypothetical protein